MDVSSDANHNRSVLTYLGEAELVLQATKKMAERTLALIDMTRHKGAHPRVGAVDAVPFIPVQNMKMEEVVQIAHRFGRFMGNMGIPVYYYGEADPNPKSFRAQAESGKLMQDRLGQYESLEERLKDPGWSPDAGPAIFNPKSGAVTVGARDHLICFNVDLHTTDLSIAKTIAKTVRHSDGGYRDVKAIGLAMEDRGMVQVSMMTNRYTNTPIARLHETIRSEAARYGVTVAGSEINGPIPLTTLVEVFKHCLQAHNFSVEQIIEKALIS
jgi:glutamate formiminotransferase